MSQNEIKASLEREKQALAEARDELKVQLHLGSLEVKQQWEQLERKWQTVSSELARASEQANKPLEDIGKATRGLLDELKHGYARVRDQLKG